ncbi:MAG: UDP-N-acetylmuramoyl-tripeptide--D-alanyl-D-alanine ligase [SAR324 cluster bacterium]|uniref:UDP-N-acetylmuramoyl-tripeptide--D-alanyl-D-alanine ligase n=1 Tax=SAR324 cluster bacterium TaxID=2024889 RepID=A0A7X9FSX7_9DELT|nr:UDP-N-acetylmuramoyl-tripeptide--D-alanyl-D-alanine ligase [SAR324 cluster bacterium]
MLNILGAFLLYLAIALFFQRRILRYLRFFQQQEYKNRLYLEWILEKRAFDSRASLLLACLSVIALFCGQSNELFILAAQLLAAIAIIIIPCFEEDPRKFGKVPLKMTERALRIYRLSLVLYSCILLLSFITLPSQSLILQSLVLIFLVQSTPLFLVAANCLLQPFEQKLQQTFLNEAKAKIRSINPYVIGITGSYGKTSTKSILAELLNVALGPTFWPPKSYNTLMGITREIRERLVPGYRYAVVEMGAYGIGSIEKLCELCPPKAGIVTAVGLMHLERFGSEANVFCAKSELAKAVPKDGILVCNGDNEGARQIAAQNPKAITLLYGLDCSKGHLDCTVSEVSFSEEGAHFFLHWKGNRHKAQTKLLGKTSLSNILAAFTMACALGAKPELLIAALQNIEPVDNRLSLQKIGDVLWLKDAYNSNPEGFAAALEVLQAIPASRRILMTPGMIELGEKQYESNYNAAKKAAGICDLLIIVGVTNRKPLEEGLMAAGFPKEKLLFMPGRQEGFEFLSDNLKTGDVVLIENDLVDLYEPNTKF